MWNPKRGLLSLAAGVAVAGGLAAVGAWKGGLVGAAVLGVGIYVAPEFSGLLARRRDQARTAQQRLDRVSVSAVMPAGLNNAGPAALLRPDRQIVGFIDRPELATLREWCDAEDQPPALLLTGAGGVGKTRLALQFARERVGLGWMCRIVRPGLEPEAIPAVLAMSSGPVLLIVDYAETRRGLVDMLRSLAEDSREKLRVLLVARSRGEWWVMLEASTDAAVRALATTAAHVRLTAAPFDADASGDLVQAAAAAFAGALGITVTGRIDVIPHPGPVSILVLHAAALLAVLNMKDQPSAGPVRVAADEQVLDDLLVRETAFWLGAAQAANLTGPEGVDSVIAAQAVAVACLFAVATEPEAAHLLGRVPGLADSSVGSRRKIARWLRELYPPDPALVGSTMARWWGSLQPDLLAERHVVSQLAAAADLAAACMRGLRREEARSALTILARACAHGSEAPGLLTAALRADLPGLGIPAVEVAVQTGGLLGRVLAEVLEDAGTPLEELISIEETIPFPTLVLADADAAVTGRIARSLPPNSPPAERARWADVLSTRLAQAGKLVPALAPAQQAVSLYREVAAASPGRYKPELAAALANLSIRLYQLNRAAEAVMVGEEAVTIRRQQVQADSTRYLPGLAISLSNLAAAYARLGNLGEALAAAHEAAGIHRQLAEANPGRYLPELAASLINLAAIFAALGRAPEARSSAQEAAGIYWMLASKQPDRFLPDLAIALTNLGALLADLSYVADAVVPSDHAVALYRQLAEISPDRYRPELAKSLTNLGTLLSELSRPAEAFAHSQEAVTIFRDLAEGGSGNHPEDLASALSNLGVSLAGLGRHADALAATEQAVTVYRELADSSPERYRPDLATSLANLGIRLASLGRRVDALKATKEAVAIYRMLAMQLPDRYHADLAASLDDLGIRYSALGQASAALPVSEEAVRIQRELAENSPDRYQPRLANSLTNLGTILGQLGRTTAALAVTQEAVRIHRTLVERGNDRFKAERASSLTNLASSLSVLGRPDEALQFAGEAVETYRDLVQVSPGRFRPFLAASIDALATALVLLDRTAEAATAHAEAEELRKQAASEI